MSESVQQFSFVGDDDHEKMGIEKPLQFVSDDGTELTKEDVVDIADLLREEILSADEERLQDIVDALSDTDNVPFELPVEEKPARVYSPMLIRELRKFDRKNKNRTCAKCARRLPISEMDNGKAEICPDCKG